jgi:2-C-methyl-D-erythritol 4-phosphate cytidylyltransferase
MKVQLLIPAAGMGRRLGFEQPKALVRFQGKPLLLHTLERLSSISFASPPIIVFPSNHLDDFESALSAFCKPVKLIPGGQERQDSVQCGLNVLDEDTEIVVIHDAARPFPPLSSVLSAIEAAEKDGAATLAIPVTDTILMADRERFLSDTPDRSCLWACQTPQVFQIPIIQAAYFRAQQHKVICTDDASLVKQAGFPVRLIEGTPANIKITTPSDLCFAEYLLERHLS